MKRIVRSAAATLVATLATWLAFGAAPAHAATGSWVENQTHYNIYFDGGWATMYFSKPPTSLPLNGLITSTTIVVRPYSNGNTSETIRICYQQVYSSTDYLCWDAGTITGSTTYTPTLFNGLNARGKITIRHTLVGGTYPATGVGVQDGVTVTYQY